MRTRRLLVGGLVVAGGIGLAGCVSSGLSTRETGRQNYSGYVYSRYDDDSQVASIAQQPTLMLPARMAVAQIGEVAPPAGLLQVLRAEPAIFQRAEGIPGISGEPVIPICNSLDKNSDAQRDYARRQMTRMRQVAHDMQMNYRLVVGGTIDETTTSTGLSLFDLTIVGAFVVPSQEIQATARASAALIDIVSGRVVLITSAEADRSKLASSVGQEGDLLDRLRDGVVERLARQVVADCRQRANQSGQAAVQLQTGAVP